MKPEVLFHTYSVNQNKARLKALAKPKEHKPHVLVAENKCLAAKVERKVIGEGVGNAGAKVVGLGL